MKYAWIEQQHGIYPVCRMCRILQVSRSGFYAWRCRPTSARQAANDQLLIEIRRVHAQSHENYGIVKCWKALNYAGIACGRNRVARLRQSEGIYARRRKRSVLTTHSRRNQWCASDLVRRRFKAEKPNQLWVGDVTFVATRSGWLYVAVLLDLYSRKIVGWSMSTQNNGALVLDCLSMALEQRQPEAGLIHHSDRGSSYTQRAYRSLLCDHGIRQSMGRAGECWDNAVAESFFNNLKNEMVHERCFDNPDEAKAAVFEYVEIFYNRQRLHQSLNYQTPEQFEMVGEAA